MARKVSKKLRQRGRQTFPLNMENHPVDNLRHSWSLNMHIYYGGEEKV